MISSRVPSLAIVVAALNLLLTTPLSAQTFLDLFKKGEGNPFAPVENGFGIVPPNNVITPTNPDAGNVTKEPEQKEKAASSEAKATAPPKGGSKAVSAKEKAAAEKEKLQEKEKVQDDDEDEDALFEYEEPRRVTVTLPIPRPGIRVASAADVAPIGAARWNAGKEQLPPGVNFQQAVPVPNPALPGATRVAALPQTQNAPRWSSSDVAPLRPSTLRDVEAAVPHMPGVYAPPEANFQCLPVGVKQVLVDTAKRFGHVAILNAKRPRGTGARASYHYQCRAVDFRVRGVPVSTVYSFLKAHPNVGGRKIYPFGFFHIDDGPVRSW